MSVLLPSAFSVYASKGYSNDLLPIIPPGATLSDQAGDGVAASRGKIPGKRAPDGWVGFKDWAKHSASEADLARWASWGAGVGLQARKFPAFDIDVSDAPTAELLHSLVVNIAGFTPSRVGRPPRRLLPYWTDQDLTKRRFAFRLPGDDTLHAIELLGAGQQYVIDGVHPKTNQPYAWTAPLPPADFLPVLTADIVERIFAEVAAAVALLGGEPATTHQGGARGAGVALGGLLAPSLDAVRDALAAVPNDVDYDTWIKVGVAVKASTGASEDGRALWCDWSDQYTDSNGEADSKWDSFRPPFSIGWDFLSRWAVREGGFNSARHEFEPVTETEATTELGDDPLAKLHKQYVWVHRDEVAFDTETREILGRNQFNVRNNHVGDPSSSKTCAWAQWQRDPEALRQVQRLTYRPGQSAFVSEEDGLCANVWTPSSIQPARSVHDTDVRIWTDHVAYLYPNAEERGVLLDWLAYLVQDPGEKPQFSVLLGSTAQGVGKDVMLKPIIMALGQHNVEQTSAGLVCGRFSSWAENRRLIIVQEMEQFGTQATADKLKPFQAKHPEMIPIEKKGRDAYLIPNIFAMLFLTNNQNAMQMAGDDRRTYVMWSYAAPKDSDYYEQLSQWTVSGGAEKLFGWLLQRDIGAFRKLHRAPMTEHKQMMVEVSRAPLDEWIEEGVASYSGVFASDLLTAADVFASLPPHMSKTYLTLARIGSKMRAHGARELRRIRVTDISGMQQIRVYALRNFEQYAALSPQALREAYEAQKELHNPFKTEVAA